MQARYFDCGDSDSLRFTLAELDDEYIVRATDEDRADYGSWLCLALSPGYGADALSRSNWNVLTAMVEDTPGWRLISGGYKADGVFVDPADVDAMDEARDIIAQLESNPVLDEDGYSALERSETWIDVSLSPSWLRQTVSNYRDDNGAPIFTADMIDDIAETISDEIRGLGSELATALGVSEVDIDLDGKAGGYWPSYMANEWPMVVGASSGTSFSDLDICDGDLAEIVLRYQEIIDTECALARINADQAGRIVRQTADGRLVSIYA